MKRFLRISLTLFGASILGWVLIVLSANKPPTAFDRASMFLGFCLAFPAMLPMVLIMWLEDSLQFSMDNRAALLASGLAGALLWGFLLSKALPHGGSGTPEPTAAPNGGPAKQSGNSGGGEGPPSVS